MSRGIFAGLEAVGLACPFCGGKPVRMDGDDAKGEYRIQCWFCGFHLIGKETTPLSDLWHPMEGVVIDPERTAIGREWKTLMAIFGR